MKFNLMTIPYVNDDDGDDEYHNFYGIITQHMPLQGRLDTKPC